MTVPRIELASQPSFTATWSATSAADDLQRWSDFLTSHGITWSADATLRDFVDQVIRSAGTRAGEAIELRLEKLTNDALKRADDPRRVYRLIPKEPTRRWYLLAPAQRTALEQAGHRFEAGMQSPLLALATIPLTLGVYFTAQHACRVAGVDETVAWVIALLAYVLTVRAVRGHWPLQRRR